MVQLLFRKIQLKQHKDKLYFKQAQPEVIFVKLQIFDYHFMFFPSCFSISF